MSTTGAKISGSDSSNGTGADLPFEEFARRYNFRNTPRRSLFFTELLIRELSERAAPRTVVDIGCGRGMERHVALTWRIREHVERFWGTEPDKDVTPEPGLFDHFQHAMMETADLPDDAFDLAYSYMVMEHVEEPEGFLRAVYKCLKPGGRYYFITPNGRHYFGRATRFLKAMKLDELVLRCIKGQERVERYHYPVQYRCNTPEVISRLAERVGFNPPEFVFTEEASPDGYLPGPLRPVLHAMNFKRKLVRRPTSLLNLIARLTKP